MYRSVTGDQRKAQEGFYHRLPEEKKSIRYEVMEAMNAELMFSTHFTTSEMIHRPFNSRFPDIKIL